MSSNGDWFAFSGEGAAAVWSAEHGLELVYESDASTAFPIVSVTNDGSVLVSDTHEEKASIWERTEEGGGHRQAVELELPIGGRPDGPFPFFGLFSTPVGISSNGETVVGSGDPFASPKYGVVWRAPDFGFEVLDFPDNAIWTHASEVSGDGRMVAGGTIFADRGPFATTWNLVDGTNEVITDANGDPFTSVRLLSDDGGSMVVGKEGARSELQVVIDPSGRSREIDALVFPLHEMDNAGSIVAGLSDGLPVIWSAHSGHTLLVENWLEQNGVIPPSSWEFQYEGVFFSGGHFALGAPRGGRLYVSADGRVVSGTALRNGVEAAWVVHLAVPEPTAACLFLLCAFLHSATCRRVAGCRLGR